MCDALRDFARESDHFQRQTFQLADAGIVARQNAGGRQQLLQTIDDDIARAIHALVQSLHRQVGTVAIDDQSRQQVGFGKHQPVGVGVVNHALAMRQGLQCRRSQKERPVDRFRLGRRAAAA